MTARNKAILALLLVAPALTVSIYGGMYLQITALWVIGKPWIFIVPLLWHLFVDRQPVSWSPVRRGGMGVAFAFGLLSVAAMFATWYLIARHYVSADLVREKTAPLGLDTPTVFILGSLYWITINSLLEEYAFRWFIFRKFEIALGAPSETGPSDEPQRLTPRGVLAIVLTSLVFVLHHGVVMALFFDWWINLICCVGIFVGSAVWSWLYLRYRSIWPCYLAHACADIPIFTLGYLLLFP